MFAIAESHILSRVFLRRMSWKPGWSRMESLVKLWSPYLVPTWWVTAIGHKDITQFSACIIPSLLFNYQHILKIDSSVSKAIQDRLWTSREQWPLNLKMNLRNVFFKVKLRYKGLGTKQGHDRQYSGDLLLRWIRSALQAHNSYLADGSVIVTKPTKSRYTKEGNLERGRSPVPSPSASWCWLYLNVKCGSRIKLVTLCLWLWFVPE